MAGSLSSLSRWWHLPTAITLALLAFNSPWMRLYLPEYYRRRVGVYGLHLEMNAAVWWTAVLFLLAAALFYEEASRGDRKRRRPYIELSLVMLVILVDEVGSLHEHLSGFGGWLSLAPFGLVMVALFGDAIRLLWRDRRSRPVAVVVLLAVAVLGSVPLQEYAEHNLTSRSWSEWWGRFLEEATELLGAHLLLAAAVYARRVRWGSPAAAVVPDPRGMRGLRTLLTVGFGLHLAAAQILYLPRAGPSRWYGNPAAVYPLIVFFLLACLAFWEGRRGPAETRPAEVVGFWNAVGVFFLACSLGFVQNLWRPIGGLVPGLGRRHFYEPVPIWVLLILAVWVIGWSLRRRLGRRTLLLLALPLAALLGLHLEHLAAQHLAAGLFALLCALALLDGRELPGARGTPSSAAGRSG